MPRDVSKPGRAPSDSRPLRRDLRAIMVDGAAFSLMVGVGETYLPAFALAVGMGEVASGLVATMPLLAGALLQLASPFAVRRIGSHRRWVVACAACQALSFVPLLAGIAYGYVPAALVFFCAAVYWGSGMSTGPAWNTWVEGIVPSKVRSRYFARRTRVSQAGVLIGFATGGFALEAGTALDRRVSTFALLFMIAAVCRFVSAWFLASQSEPERSRPSEHRRVPLGQLVRRFGRGPDGRLLMYLFAVQGAVQISGPYFTPYMLRQLEFSYADFVSLVGLSYLGKVLALPTLGQMAQRCGARRLLWIGGLGIVPLPALWLVSNSFGFLAIVQFAGGCAWAAYELAMFLLFFEAIDPAERTSVLTVHNLAHATATVMGSLLGAAILALGGKQPSTYLMIYALSAAVRLLTLGLLLRIPRGHAFPAAVATRTLAIRPTDGSIDRPILPSIAEPALPTSLEEEPIVLAGKIRDGRYIPEETKAA